MTTFLFILLIAAMIAVVVVLVRGLAIFLLNASNEVKGEGKGPSASALQSNKMMQYRIFFQAIAILIVVIILFLAGKH
jgi:heme/copper-type cytochrome/quinol oxidase subunit 2